MVEGINRVMVIGAGVMGHGIAQAFAMNGYRVDLVEAKQEALDQGLGWIKANLETAVELGRLVASEVEPILGRISPGLDAAAIAPGADFVAEAATENLELKLELFKLLDRTVRPEVVIASNTSSYDIDELAAAVRHQDRIIGAHWFHPPPITPCVEVIAGNCTGPKAIETTTALLQDLGKFPTACKSAPGFVANRIQLAMAAEALKIVEEGLAEPADVDRIVKSSFGFRLSAFGPFEIIDQAGVDVYQAVFQYLHQKLQRDHFKPSPLLGELIDQGKIGLKAGRGFYGYADGAAEQIKKERDKRLFDRTELFRRENLESE